MVSILPAKRGPWNTIADAMKQFGQNAPELLERRYQTQQGLNAINELQTGLESAKDPETGQIDMTKALPLLAKAYTQNPSLERSGLGQAFLQQSKVGGLYGKNQPGQSGQPGQNQILGQGQEQTNQPRPTAYNITTPEEDDAEARRAAEITGNPAQYQQTLAERTTKNQISKEYKNNLENMALRQGISPQELPDFMQVGERFASQNPDQWLKNTREAYAPIKSSFDKLERSFIPGLGSGLIGKNRDEALKKITPDVQDLVKMGREDQARTYLASQFLSPTEVEEQIRPLEKKQKVGLSRLPMGVFPPEKKETYKDVLNVFKGKLSEKHVNPFVSYETALEKAPKEMKIMQDRLADFFLKNVDDKTSLLVLRDKLWDEKHYDWRQIGPAIDQARKNGLKLDPRQLAELSDINSQPPIQSLPDMFQSWDRFVRGLRGQK